MKAKRLKKGDTIALIAPSAAIGVYFPHRVEQGVKALKELGFKVRLMPSTSALWNGQGGTPEERGREITEVFADPVIAGIVCLIGGLSANSVVPHIDYEVVKQNPKVFCGYSDIGVLHYVLRSKTGLVTFYGPCVISEFAEYPHPHDYTIQSFMRAVCEAAPLGAIEPSSYWTDEFLDWSQKLDQSRPRTLRPNTDGNVWLKKGKAKGILTGGCLYTVHQMRGTGLEGSYDGKILILETPEGTGPGEGFPLAFVESQLEDLKLSGILSRVAGIVVGRPMGYSDEQQQQFVKILEQATKDYSVPVLINVNVGHAAPIATIPLGVEASLDGIEGIFSITEAGVC